MELTAVFLAAGISSRFGGKMKALAKVGPNDETLLELSLRQIAKAGFDNVVMIASHATLEPLQETFGDSFENMPIGYCIQETPEYRQKPLGTTHAILSSRDLVDNPFVTLNADELCGEDSLKKLAEFMRSKEDALCVVGYELQNVLPDKGKVNRGLIIEKDGILDKVEEQFGIGKEDIPDKYTGKEPIAINLFGLQTDFFEFAEKDLKEFLEEHPDDPKTEILLPITVTRYLEATDKKMHVLKVSDPFYGLTNPEDEAVMREKLKA